MGHQYAGNPAAYPIDYTIPDDGDAIDAASVNVALEALGDRTANTKGRIDLFQIPGEGVCLLRRVGNIAGLRALTSTDHTDRQICYVDEYRLFMYDAGNTTTDDGDRFIQPSDVTGAGRWVAHDRDAPKLRIGYQATAAGVSTFTVPPGVNAIFIHAVGGGGGGAAGSGSISPGCGGGGGGGARGRSTIVQVVPGSTVTVTVGAGGAGGAGPNATPAAVSGSGGGDTKVAITGYLGAPTLVFRGAQGGQTNGGGSVSQGGMPGPFNQPAIWTGEGPFLPGQGGGSANSANGTQGNYSQSSPDTLSPGSGAFNAGAFGGGGGGGLAEGDHVGSGGSGGAGNATVGVAGSAAGGNGSGGGGGGAGFTTGGAGGNGGDGYVYIGWMA